MKLVERHIYNYNHEMDHLTFQSKNIYNTCLYIIRQEYIKTNKYLGSKNLYYNIIKEPIWESCGLPKKIALATMHLVDQNFYSFFRAHQSYITNPQKFQSKPQIIKYKHSVYGRCPVFYPKQALYALHFKKTGYIKLSKTNIEIKTQIEDWDSIKQVNIIPKNNHFVVDVIYEKEEKPLKENDNISAIDLGLNNLATVSFNDGKEPFILNGKPLKSINQYYNKNKGKLQSKLTKEQYNSKRITKLTNKRNNKITDYLHKASRYIVNQLVFKNISKLIIGYNKQWKQDINIGKRNNQNFVNIPFYKFISMLEYKCKLEGIDVVINEESYTSKCSFLDSEPIKKHEVYMGNRIKRGMFKSSKGLLINADLNASYNIMRKVVPELLKGIEGFAVSPRLVTV